MIYFSFLILILVLLLIFGICAFDGIVEDREEGRWRGKREDRGFDGFV